MRLGAKSNDDFAVSEKQVNRLIAVIRRNSRDKLLGKADADGDQARAAFGLELAKSAIIKALAAPEPPQAAIDALRTRMGTAPARAILGQDSERHPGGVALRVRSSGDNTPVRIPPPPQDSLALNPAPTDEADDPAAALRQPCGCGPQNLLETRAPGTRPSSTTGQWLSECQGLTNRGSNRQASALEAEKHRFAACCQGSHS